MEVLPQERQESEIISKFEGVVKFEEVRTISTKNSNNKKVDVVIGRTGEFKIIDKLNSVIFSVISLRAHLSVSDGDVVKKEI